MICQMKHKHRESLEQRYYDLSLENITVSNLILFMANNTFPAILLFAGGSHFMLSARLYMLEFPTALICG